MELLCKVGSCASFFGGLLEVGSLLAEPIRHAGGSDALPNMASNVTFSQSSSWEPLLRCMHPPVVDTACWGYPDWPSN